MSDYNRIVESWSTPSSFTPNILDGGQ